MDSSYGLCLLIGILLAILDWLWFNREPSPIDPDKVAEVAHELQRNRARTEHEIQAMIDQHNRVARWLRDHEEKDIFHQSENQTIYRFANGNGASLVRKGNGYSFASLKFTDDPDSPFFIHYFTSVGGPRNGLSESDARALVDQVRTLTDDPGQAR